MLGASAVGRSRPVIVSGGVNGHVTKFAVRQATPCSPAIPATSGRALGFSSDRPQAGRGRAPGWDSDRAGLRWAKFVDAIRVGELPGSNPPVAGIVQPLRTESLRTTLVHRDAIFEIRRLPCWDTALGCTLAHPLQRPTLELWFPDRMLSDEPCRLRTVFADDVFGGPALLLDDLPQTGGILDVNRLHARNIGPAELVRGQSSSRTRTSSSRMAMSSRRSVSFIMDSNLFVLYVKVGTEKQI